MQKTLTGQIPVSVFSLTNSLYWCRLKIYSTALEEESSMDTPKIYESEYRFCLILWAHEPVKSSELVKLCAQQLGWKPTTTYTVIKRLSQRGVLKNENTVVTSLISKEVVQAAEVDALVEKTFEGSLPAFLAAFARRQDLSPAEVEEIRRIIEK